MIRAVLDTNVLVSALLSPKGRPAIILQLALSKQFCCYISESLLKEYVDLLERKRFGWDRHRIARLIRNLRAVFILVAPKKTFQLTRDSDDNKILECAVEAGADFIVTGNIRDFPSQFHGVRVVTPRDFLFVLSSSPNPF